MPRPLLTIAIPTFNRAPFLAESLSAFERETSRVTPEDVAFLIIDNCSTDDTASVVARFAERRPHVTYRRNAENTGAERNIMSCALASEGEFTWIFGDDDLPAYGSVAKILKSLREDEATDLYLLNYTQMNRTMSGVMCRQVLAESDDAELPSLRAFFGYPGSADVIGFISSIIFRTARIRNASFEEYVAFGSYYGHFGALMEGFRDARSRYFGKPMVLQRQGNQRVDDAEGAHAHTFKPELGVFLGFIRILARLLEKQILAPADLDRITAKLLAAPFPTDCLPIIDWWIDRVLRDVLMKSLVEPPEPAFLDAFNELHELVIHRDLGRATHRLRNILDVSLSTRIAVETPGRP
jgi:glycosyltransferase involved in cell wall biosynthesis